MSESLCKCPQNCGQPAKARGYASACYQRWRAAGRPASGPPVPVSPQDAGYRSADARNRKSGLVVDDSDALSLAIAGDIRVRRAAEPERRATRAKGWASALVRCVAADDAEGIRLLLHRVTDWPALAVVLAECADPYRTAVVTAAHSATPAAARRSPAPAYDGTPELSPSILTRSEGAADAA